MKILVHLNHGADKSYLLGFAGRITTRQEVKAILKDRNEDRAITTLFAHSARRVPVSPKDRQKAEGIADFVVSQHGYTAERLA